MTSPKKCCDARTNRWVIAAAIAALILGAILSRVIEPGVRVEKIMLMGNTPAIRLFPATPGPHPIALLAHEATGSKENCFRFGEALAAAGFDCYSVDQAGHAGSQQPCSFWHVDGKWRWATNILLKLRALTNAQVVISPWSDHLFEPFDPVLVNAAVKAACATVGKPVPAAPTAWRWRFTGLVLGMAGALVLMFCLPELRPRLARTRRWIVPAVLLVAIILTMGTWIGVTPQLRRIPLQLVLLVVIWLALAGLSRLRLPRWCLPVVTAISALGCLALLIAYPANMFLFAMSMSTLAISTLFLLPGTLVGEIATRGGSRRDGDVAMAIFASDVIGQFMPLFY